MLKNANTVLQLSKVALLTHDYKLLLAIIKVVHQHSMEEKMHISVRQVGTCLATCNNSQPWGHNYDPDV